MSIRCNICGKKRMIGNSVARRGLPKKKKGIGLKTTGITRRKFMPNLQTKTVTINGKIKKIRICTKCIKAGKLITLSR